MDFYAEILFHVLPLAMLLLSLTAIFKNTSRQNIIWICILFVALLEPTYQTIAMVSAKQFPLWAVVNVWLHVFLLNVFQLLLFKRYDSVAMYSFRLVYYKSWHIGWGYLRLKIPF